MADQKSPTKTWDVRLLDDKGLKFETLAIKDLQVDYEYQRPLREAKISQMWTAFDPAEMTAVVVSRRKDGSLWILDGQHRVELLRRLGKAVVLCDVRENLSIEEEAHLFYRLNEGQTQVGSWDKWKARVRSREPIAIRVEQLLAKFGYHTGKAMEDRGFQAVTALEDAFEHGQLEWLLSVISTCWPHDRLGRESTAIYGLAAFGVTYRSTDFYDDGRLVEILDKLPPAQFIRRAKEIAIETGRSGAKGQLFAVALREAYNGQMQRGSKPKRQLYGVPILPKRSHGRKTGLRPG